MIIGGSGSAELAKKVAQELGEKLAKTEYKKFPDGEVYIRLREPVKGEVIIVQGTHHPQYENLAELLFWADLARSEGAEKVTAVVPYLAHARQDKRFEEGELVSSDTIIKLLKAVGVGAVLTVDLHFYRKEGKFDLRGINGYNVAAAGLLADYARKMRPGVLVVTPDAGSVEQAKAVGGKSLEKKRKSSFEVEIAGLPDVEGKDVMILDDMITTGGTMRKAVDNARKAGAKTVIAAATHAAFCAGGYEKVKEGADYLITTDSIPFETGVVSVAPKIAGALKKWKR